LHQPIHVQVLRAHTIQWRKASVEHVVHPAKLARALDRANVTRFFDDANERAVSPLVAADVARIVLGEVGAHRAPVHTIGEPAQRVGELAALLRRLAQQMVGEPERSLATDSRKPRQLRRELVDGRHQKGILNGSERPPVIFCISSCAAVAAFFCTSVTATSTRSSSISTSVALMADGSIWMRLF